MCASTDKDCKLHFSGEYLLEEPRLGVLIFLVVDCYLLEFLH